MKKCHNPISLKDTTEYSVKPNVDPGKPGIYLWEIETVGCYVGQYKRKTRPLGDYNNNVRKMCHGEPYRKGKPDNFRRIHHMLHDALHQGKQIHLTILENTSVETLNERESFWIAKLGANLNGPNVSSLKQIAQICIRKVRINAKRLSVDLMDGRIVSLPLAWYPRLFKATAEQRANWQIVGGGYGIHWPDIDEDLSAEGLLQGLPASKTFIDAE